MLVSSADAYSGGLTCLVALFMNFPSLNLRESCSHWDTFLWAFYLPLPQTRGTTKPLQSFGDAASRQRLRILKDPLLSVYVKLPAFWESKSVKCQQLHMSQLLLSAIATRQAYSSCSLAAYLSYLDFASGPFLLEKELALETSPMPSEPGNAFNVIQEWITLQWGPKHRTPHGSETTAEAEIPGEQTFPWKNQDGKEWNDLFMVTQQGSDVNPCVGSKLRLFLLPLCPVLPQRAVWVWA